MLQLCRIRRVRCARRHCRLSPVRGCHHVCVTELLLLLLLLLLQARYIRVVLLLRRASCTRNLLYLPWLRCLLGHCDRCVCDGLRGNHRTVRDTAPLGSRGTRDGNLLMLSLLTGLLLSRWWCLHW